MGSVHDRWELVEPLIFAQMLRAPDGFARSATKRERAVHLEAIRREHRFDESAIAHAFSLCGDMPSVDEPEMSIASAIRDASDRWLTNFGTHWGLTIEHRSPGHEIVRWRGLTMLLPPSIVVAGALSANRLTHPTRIQALPSDVSPRGRVAHLHVHLGPMLPFESLWLRLWTAFLRHGSLDCAKDNGIDTIKGSALPELAPSHEKRRPGAQWQWLLEQAFAARAWLQQQDDGARANIELPRTLYGFRSGRVDVETRTRTLLSFWQNDECFSPYLRRLRRRAEREAMDEEREASRTERRGGPPTAKSSNPPHLDDVDAEIALVSRALRRCDANASLEKALYQYLRVKVALYSRLVVDPWTTGLRHFLDVVQRDEKYANVANERNAFGRIRLDAGRSEAPLTIDALEIHTTPPAWLKRASDKPSRAGWIISFVRAARPEPDDEGGTRGARQWLKTARETSATCRLLARIFASRPSHLKSVRGVSLMHWERNGPVWLFESALRKLVHESKRIAAENPGRGIQPLRTAFHLGEDFDHLLTGLRQIYEPFAWRLIEAGDRIGHAMALGLSTHEWQNRHEWIRMRPWDRLLDIGFVYWAVCEHRLIVGADDLERLRIDARMAISTIFETGSSDPLNDARDLWLSLPSPSGTVSSRQPIPKSGSGLDVRALSKDRRVGQRALSMTLTVQTELDKDLLERVHSFVRARVAAAHVAIEVNPSSNLLIGGFRSIFDQPVFHADDLPITFHADDPLTFATTLADDYAYAWAAMIMGGKISATDATQRLEKSAELSRRFAFGGPKLDVDGEQASSGSNAEERGARRLQKR